MEQPENLTSIENSSNRSFTEDVISYETHEWGFWLKVVATPVIACIGIVGNTLSFAVMKSETLRRKSYSHYLCALSVFDTLTLIIRLLGIIDEYHVYYLAIPGLFHTFISVSCKLYNFLTHVITLMSAWLVVCMALERLLAVCFPFKIIAIRSQSGAVCSVIILTIIVCLSQSFRFVMIDHVLYDTVNNISDCLAVEDSISLYTGLEVYYYNWTLIFLLPDSIVLICNSLVLYQIFKVRKEFHKETNSRVNRVVRTTHRSTFMLLFVTFAYIFTLMPMFVLSVTIDLSIKLDTRENARMRFLNLKPYLDFSECVALLNYAMNFLIYVVSGRSFRFELRRRIDYCNTYPSRFKRSITGRSKSTREECIRLQ